LLCCFAGMMPRLSHSVYWGSWSWKASRFSQPFLVDPRATSTHLFTGQFLNETAKGKDFNYPFGYITYGS
jgi:hypothetical protein